MPNTDHYRKLAIPESIKPFVTIVSVADGKSIEGSHVADYMLASNIQDNPTEFIPLREARLIDGLTAPLISVSKLCDQGYSVLFEKSYAYINNRKSKVPIYRIDRRRQHDSSLYKIEASALQCDRHLYDIQTKSIQNYEQLMALSREEEACFMSTYSGSDKLVALHNACMHLNYGALAPIYENLYKTKMPKEVPFCDACAAAKVHKVALPKAAQRKPRRINQIIGMDFIVFSKPDRYGNKYLLHIQCKYSKHLWGYPSRTRAIMTKWAICFIKFAERQHPDFRVATVSFDNELATNSFMGFLAETGIKPYKTAPYNSTQNFVERPHRTIQEAAKAMLARAGTPTIWLMQACLYAIDIFNHLPRHSEGGTKERLISPSEVWNRYRARSLKDLLKIVKPFGCAMWAVKPPPLSTKQSLRGEAGLLMGRAPYSKCWLMFSLERRKMVEVLHCVTNETSFPLADAAAPRKSLSLQRLFENYTTPMVDDDHPKAYDDTQEESTDDDDPSEIDESSGQKADDSSEQLDHRMYYGPQPLSEQEPAIEPNILESDSDDILSVPEARILDFDGPVDGEKPALAEPGPSNRLEALQPAAERSEDGDQIGPRRSSRLKALQPIAEGIEEVENKDMEVDQHPGLDSASCEMDFGSLEVGHRLKSLDDVLVEVAEIDDRQNIVCYEPEMDDKGPYTYDWDDLKHELFEASTTVDQHIGPAKEAINSCFDQPIPKYNYIRHNPFDGPVIYFEETHTYLPSTPFVTDDGDGLDNDAFAFLAVERGHRAGLPKVGITLVDEIQLPSFSFEFARHPLRELIERANTKEWQDLYNADTLSEPMDLPDGFTVTPTKWVLRAKGDEKGIFTKLKSRLTLRGDLMKKPEEHKSNPFYGFSPVTQVTTMFALVTLHQHDPLVTFHQLDFEQAFLTAKMRRRVFIRPPRGYGEPGTENKVHEVYRALYGGDDSGRCFFDHITTDLKTFGLTAITHDNCYLQIEEFDAITKELHFIKMCFHVDDFLVAQKGDALWSKFCKWLKANYRFTLEKLKHFLGMLFERDISAKTIRISQQANVEKLLRIVDGIVDGRPSNCPIKAGSIEPTLENLPKEPKALADAKYFPMMQVLGCLNWLQMLCYPEISYPLKVASRFNLEHGPIAHKWVRNMLHYLQSKTNVYRVIRYQGHMQLDAYADSNHLKDKSTCRPISGAVIRLGGNLIRHICQREKHVTHSAPESETYAVALTSRAVMACRYLIEEMGGPPQGRTRIRVDCNAAIHWCTNPVHTNSNGHMHSKFFYTRDLHEKKLVQVVKVKSEHNLADLLITWKNAQNFITLTTALKESRQLGPL